MRNIIMLGLLLLLLAGCKGDGNTPTVDAYKKGTDGLVMTFLKGAPAAKMYENTEFIVGVQIKNKGAYEIKDGLLLLNLEQDYMKSDNNKYIINLLGRSLYNPNGAFDTVQFQARTMFIDAQSEKHTSQVIATACYEYFAETSQSVCIDADYISVRPGKKVCEVKDITLNDQGGPVAITKIEQRMIPRSGSLRAQYIIHIQNKGKGTPVNRFDTKAACGTLPNLGPSYWNMVHLHTFQLSQDSFQYYSPGVTSGQVECKPNPVRLVDGIGQVTCTTSEITPQSSYIAPLNIILAYGYTESISTPVQVDRRA